MSIDTAAFTEFVRQGWNAKAQPYHELLGPLSPRVVDELVEGIGVAEGILYDLQGQIRAALRSLVVEPRG